MQKLAVFLMILAILPIYAEIRIPLFGGSITIRNHNDGSVSVATEKKVHNNTENLKTTSFTIRNGTVDDFEFSTNSTKNQENGMEASKKLRPSQRRPKSDVLNALLSMFGRF